MCANIDSDLYESYEVALPYVYKYLSKGGYIHLDEYYSLNKQKYKISDLNEIYEAKLKEFEKLKNEVDKHSKFMVKHLGKKLGIHKE